MERELLGGQRQKVQTARAEIELSDGRVLVLKPVRVKNLARFEELRAAMQEESSHNAVGQLLCDSLELAGEATIAGKPVHRADFEDMDIQELVQCNAALVGVMQWIPFGGAEPETAEEPTPKVTRSKKG